MSFESNVQDIMKNVVFYGDTYDKSVLYAEYFTHGGTVRKLTPVENKTFQAYLRNRIRKLGLKKITAAAVTEYVKDYYETEAFPPKITTHLRTAGSLRGKPGESPVIEYNLANDQQQTVIIEPGGWYVSDKPRHKFLSLAQTHAQVTPVRSSYSLIDLIAKYVNLRGDMLILFVIWLVQGFSQGSHFCATISAERGSGKSSCGRVIRKILDPSAQDITTYPDRFDGLQTALSNNYLSIFDNLSSYISKRESDLLCSAITGATITKRALYTTNEMFTQKIHGIVVINGIFISPEFPDLAERTLLFKLQKFTPSNIRTEHDLWADFERDRPYILGCIFDTLSAAMNIVGTLKNEKLPRMADSGLEMTSVAMALNVDKDEFSRIYEENVKILEKERANTPLVEAVCEFMNSNLVVGRKISGTVSNLYQQIKSNYSGEKKDLPKSPSRFSQSLRSERTTLEAVSITVNFDDTYSDGTHLDIIKNKPKD